MNKIFYLKNNSPKLKIRVVISESLSSKKRKENEWWIDENNPHYVIISDLCACLYEEAWKKYPLTNKEGGEARGYFVNQLLDQALKKIGKKVSVNFCNNIWRISNCTPNIDLKIFYGDLEFCGKKFNKYFLYPKDKKKEKESEWYGRCWMNPKDKLRKENRIYIVIRNVEKESGKPMSEEDVVETFTHELVHAADCVKGRHSNMGVVPTARFYRWLVQCALRRLEFSFVA